MRRFSTILLYVTIAFLLLWQLPWCYNFFVVKPEKTPFTLYSFVIGDFAQMGQEEGKGSAFYRTLPANGIHVRTCGFKNAG